MEKSNMIHYKALLPALNNVIDTNDYCCKMKPDGNTNIPWELHGYSDADYARNNDNRRSFTRYIVIIIGAVIHLRL